MVPHNAFTPSLYAVLVGMERKGCAFILEGKEPLSETIFEVSYPDEGTKDLMQPWVARHNTAIDQALMRRRFYRAQRHEDMAHS